MKKSVLFRILLLAVSFFAFWWLESGFKIEEISVIVKPLVFTAAVCLTFSVQLKKYLFYVILLLNSLMVFLYLMWQIPLANISGSLGIGILVVLIISYLGDLVKDGFVRKL